MSEALNPQQFGKYSIAPEGWNTVVARHSGSGRRVGYINWFSGSKQGHRHVQGSPDPEKPAVFKAYVSGPQRRKGIGTAMFNYVNENLAPGLQHSGPQALSDDAKAWIEGMERKRP